MGLAKIAGYSWCENKLSCFFIHSQGAIKHPFSLVVETVGKLSSCNWVFCKMNSLPEKPPTDYICTIERFITVLYDCMTALTKAALYQHSLKAIYQGSCVRVSTRKGK